MERVYSHLLTAIGAARAGGSNSEQLALARLACDPAGAHPQAAAELIALLELAEQHDGPPAPGRRFPPSLQFVMAALTLARTPGVVLPDHSD
jgi:hypothetical protein